jgi:hypothetical protein
MVNEPRYRKMTELAGNVVEVEMTKAKVHYKLPLQICLMVYQLAKLRMLQFYYDCLDTFVSRQDFELCEMDTDSLYLALATPSLELAVKPAMKERFKAEYKQWFPRQACSLHEDDFFNSIMTPNPPSPFNPATCSDCATIAAYDKRTPGLFKLEFKGDIMISLCSKTYFCRGDYNKLSTKGLNKQQNPLSQSDFQQVLTTKQSGGGSNTGFRLRGNTMYTYTQHRKALSYFYIKRKVHTDGVSTFPLQI